MKNNPILMAALLAAIVAIIVVVVLNILGHDNPVVIAGGVAGGVVGALTPTLLKK